MRYEVGDKVRIKSLEWYVANKKGFSEYVESPDNRNGYAFTASMANYCGRVAEITEVLNEGTINTYRLDIDSGLFFWHNFMFENLVSENVYPVRFGELWLVFDEVSKSMITTEFYLTKEDAENEIRSRG